MKTKNIEAMAAKAARALKEMGFDADLMIFDQVTPCVTDDDYANSVEIFKLTDLPELLADPKGFIARRFRKEPSKKTENNVVPFH
jgi:hypothetical protein